MNQKEQRRLERQQKAQLARIAKTDGQDSILKWIELACEKPYRGVFGRPVLSKGYISDYGGKPALAATDGYHIHLSWVGIENLPEWVLFKKSTPVQDYDRFPNYQAVIPNSTLTQKVTLQTNKFIAAIKQAQVYARDSAQCMTLTGNPAENILAVSAKSRDKGDITVYLDSRGGHNAFTVNLDAQYVLDALKIWSEHDRVDLEVHNANAAENPVIIGQFGYKMAMIMPMRMNR